MRSTKAVATATPSTVREINRAVTLNLIRLHEPVSRKELSNLSKIFPSNISAIVDQLIEEGLVLEKRSRRLARGRTPIDLYLNPNHLRVLGVNLRGDRTRVAWAGMSGRILGTVSFKTPSSVNGLIVALKRAVELARKSGDEGTEPQVHCIGISVAGLVEPGSGTVVMSPALPQFSGYALGRTISKELGLPVLADNDCNAGVLGELWHNEGEAAGAGNVVFLSFSEVGVGSGLVINSELYRGHNLAWAGEFGHMVVDPAGPKCRCGRRGCWELYVSNQSTWRRYDAETGFTEERFRDLLHLAQEGDSRAVSAFETTAEYISLGLSNITFALNPSVIVVGGEITKVWRRIRRTIESAWTSPSVHTEILLSRFSLGDLYIRGAVALALQDIFAGPRLGSGSAAVL
ncbi:MAG: ROK family protein [Bryobacteraceae bacterium]